jgi:hypothetical protein
MLDDIVMRTCDMRKRQEESSRYYGDIKTMVIISPSGDVAYMTYYASPSDHAGKPGNDSR